MHMADALLSPMVGGGFWAGTLAVMTFAGKKLRRQMNEKLVPLMGVLGAFVFAAQMINFTIPGTGSSGHLGGGLILAIILGPHAAFIVIASVLTVQGLFFADGGLIALGSNIWNLGFYPCYIAYPLVYRLIAKDRPSSKRITIASVASAIVALQLGSFSVVLQTVLSGVSEIPFRSFLLLMQPIHLVIGIVEGFVTAGVVNYLRSIQPDILDVTSNERYPVRTVIISLVLFAVFMGGVLSLFASRNPDGLEWSIENIVGNAGSVGSDSFFSRNAEIIQKKTVIPDYGSSTPDTDENVHQQWPSVNKGTSASRVLGGIIVVLFVFITGLILKAGRRHAREQK